MNTSLDILNSEGPLATDNGSQHCCVCQCFLSGYCKQASLPAGGAVAPYSSTAPGSTEIAAPAAGEQFFSEPCRLASLAE